MKPLIRPAVAAMKPYTPGEQPGNPKVLKLNTNENPYPPSPAVARALSAFPAETLRRYPDPGCRRLREIIAHLHATVPQRVFVGNGSDEVLALCTRAFAEVGDRAAWFDPSYSLYPVLARIAELTECPVPLGPNFAWVDPPDKDAALFFLTTPNAPTGTAYPRAAVERFCDRFPGVVVLDEAYADFSDAPLGSLALERENVLTVRTLSKSYSLAGLRVGYAFGPEPLIEALFKIKDSYNLDALAQSLAEAALSDADYRRETSGRIRHTRETTAAALRERGWDVAPSEANFLWARPPDKPAAAVFEALRARHVLVRFFPGPRTGTHLRITIGTEAEMNRFLTELDALREEEAHAT